MRIHEPCQVRKEAALSGTSHVPWGSLSRANCLGNAYGTQSKEGVRPSISINNRVETHKVKQLVISYCLHQLFFYFSKKETSLNLIRIP